MKYKNILLTGGSGKLGKALIASPMGKSCVYPTRAELDIMNRDNVTDYFSRNKFDAVIHCAAFTSMAECERNPGIALSTNVLGTSNLVCEAIKRPEIRFVYLSTDYVYPGKAGPYKETDPTIPFTVYGWTKLGGECAVKTLRNHCIIRTSFFDPANIPFDTSPKDAFCSKIPLSELVDAINVVIDNDFVGTINIGQKRISLYELYKKYKPDIKPISIRDIPKGQQRAVDSSLDVNLWESICRKSQ